MEHLQQNTSWEGKRERPLPERVEQEGPHGFSVQASLAASTREWDKQFCVRDQAKDQLKWKHGPKTLTEKARLTVMLWWADVIQWNTWHLIHSYRTGFQVVKWSPETKRRNNCGKKEGWGETAGRKYSQEPSTHSIFCGLTHTRDRAPTKQA